MSSTNNDLKAVAIHSEFKLTSNIVKAHYIAKKSLLLWGSSGFGKSKSMEAIAKDLGLDIFVLPMADKSAIDMFAMGVINNKLVEYPAWWVRKLINSHDDNGIEYPDTMLFLDEITRAHPSMIPIIMEIANDHSIAGRKIRKNVFVVAASNFDSEDGGKQDLTLNQASMRRFTHVSNKLHFVTAVKHSKGLKLKVLNSIGPAYMQDFKQGEFFEDYDHAQLNCERQVTDAFEIIEAGIDFLTSTEILTILCGRVGLAKGQELALEISAVQERESKRKAPEKVTWDNFDECFSFEVDGGRLELVATLESQFKNASAELRKSSNSTAAIEEMDIVVNYLHEKAESETVSTLFAKLDLKDLANNLFFSVNLRDGSITRKDRRCVIYAFSGSKGNKKYTSEFASNKSKK